VPPTFTRPHPDRAVPVDQIHVLRLVGPTLHPPSAHTHDPSVPSRSPPPSGTDPHGGALALTSGWSSSPPHLGEGGRATVPKDPPPCRDCHIPPRRVMAGPARLHGCPPVVAAFRQPCGGTQGGPVSRYLSFLPVDVFWPRPARRSEWSAVPSGPICASLRVLIVSASMGAGHSGISRELARQLAERGHRSRTVDFVDALPSRYGPAMRALYRRSSMKVVSPVSITPAPLDGSV
jgi:hypothetical protein